MFSKCRNNFCYYAKCSVPNIAVLTVGFISETDCYYLFTLHLRQFKLMSQAFLFLLWFSLNFLIFVWNEKVNIYFVSMIRINREKQRQKFS